MSEIKPHYRIIVDRLNNLDVIELQVEWMRCFSRIKKPVTESEKPFAG
jgi:phenylacetate-coenzyme A ligase PaaK-like adenylate-forming protein